MAVEAHEYALVMKKLKEEVTAFAKMPRAEIIQADLTQQVEQIRRDYERVCAGPLYHSFNSFKIEESLGRGWSSHEYMYMC